MGLLGQRKLGPTWADWLDRLPRLFADVAADWELTFDGSPTHGFCSLVAPVRTASGRPAVLKVTFDGDTESEHEHLALATWRGEGTVRLLRADPLRRALLLERLRPPDLNSVPDVAACRIVAGRYRRLHVPAPPQLRRLSGYVGRWTGDLAALPRRAPVPRRLVEHAVALGRAFVADPATDGVMVHGDLHYENVLTAEREPWLVLDPKPMSGDPHYEVAPMLWNRWDEVVASGDVRAVVRRRFHTVVDTAGLDEYRARDWVVVRAMHNALWTITDAATAGRGLSAQDRRWITRSVAIAKAAQD